MARFSQFEIHADRCPQVLARIVGAFAAQAIVPVEMRARQSCAGFWIRLHADVEGKRAERLADRLRALVAVDAVILVHRL